MLDHNPTGGGEWRRGAAANAPAGAPAAGDDSESEEAVLEIYTPVAVEEGEEAALNYGQRSNGQLLLSCAPNGHAPGGYPAADPSCRG